MKIDQIQSRVLQLTSKLNKETFIYDLLLAYDLPRATITRLHKETEYTHHSESLLRKLSIYRALLNVHSG